MLSLHFLSPAKGAASRRRDRWAVIAVAVAAGLYGLVGSDLGLLDTLGTVFMYVVLTQAWNILGGYGGYLNFGTATYFGIGAYATALLYQFFEVSPFASWPLAGLAAAVIGLLIGIPTLRLRGAYFAVVTMIITFAVQIAVLAVPFTQGAMGVYLPRLSLDPRSLEQLFYFMFFGLAAAVTLLVYGIEHSNFGWALVAIREDEDAAEIVGVHTTEVKWIANVIAAFLTGVVGGIYSERVLYIEPTGTFTLDISLNVVLIAVIGGAASWQGPLIGAPLVLLMAQFLRVTVTSEANRVIFSLIVIVIALFVPGGVMGIVAQLRRRAALLAAKPPASPSADTS
jgi:branched-chain amino acid transport system permease protein